jgi:hypothetical protein
LVSFGITIRIHHEHIPSPDDEGLGQIDPAVFTDDSGGQEHLRLERLWVGCKDSAGPTCGHTLQVEARDDSVVLEAERETRVFVQGLHGLFLQPPLPIKPLVRP